MTPIEIWDIVDESGNKTGRLHERGKKMAPGEYHRVVHVWKHNKKDEWLINKRVNKAGDKDGGKWETTMGAVLSGEASIDAALRETKEELGIDLCPQKGVLYKSLTQYVEEGHYDFVDVWVFEHACAPDAIRLQEGETCDVQWATAEKIREMMVAGELVCEWYAPYFDDIVGKWVCT